MYDLYEDVSRDKVSTSMFNSISHFIFNFSHFICALIGIWYAFNRVDDTTDIVMATSGRRDKQSN